MRRIATGRQGARQRHQRGARVVRRQAGDHVDRRVGLVGGRPTGGGHLVERRERVARRAGAATGDHVEGVVVDLQPGVAGDVARQLGERLRGDEAKLVVLRAAADRGQHLLRISRSENEYDVGRRLFERLEQRVRRRRRQHVHFVDDVDLPAPRRRQRHAAHQVADGVDSVVGGGVEFLHVERRPCGYGEAALAESHGSPPVGFSQLSALARMRAVVVFPVPRGPLNK